MSATTEAFAKAMAAAAAADLESHPELMAAIRSGRLDRQGLESIMLQDLSRGSLFPSIRKLVTAHDIIDDAKRAGMGQWAEIAGAIGAVAGAAVSYSLGRSQISAQTSIARAAEARIAEQQAQAAAQANVQRIAYEQAAVQQRQTEAAGGGGLPSWAIPVGAGVLALGVVIYVATRR